MCLSTVYKTGKTGEPLAEYVTGIKVDGDEITLTDITGNDVVARGAITSVDLIKNVILIDASA
ncbi:MAG: CooT family nickel-binding protein [Clostridiales Family XIII bacterium]|jgi:predicted RNA-binding protein|nr:CooT family nickel-binding protein [Clostridiales Family XIII bacterium]